MALLAFDFETSGALPEYALQPWRMPKDAWATSLVWQLEGGEPQGGLNPTVDDMQRMLQFAIDNNHTLVAWNAVFDISILLAYGLEDLVFKANFVDGMMLWKHVAITPEKESWGLKSAVAKFIPDQAGYEEDIDFHDASPEARRKLHEYNIKDVQFTLQLTRYFANKLTKEQLKCAKIEAESLPIIAQSNLNGLHVDLDAAQHLVDDLTRKALELQDQLEQHGVTEEILRSPKQLAELIYDKWGLECTIFTKTGSPSTDKEALHELSLLDDRAALLREYRAALNNRTKFAETLIESAAYNGNGKTYPIAHPYGTYSGRLTYSSNQGKGKDKRQTGFALHQMKKGKEYRGLIKAPEGYTLVEFDAASQEFRWMAIASNDETMKKLCGVGQDPHQYMGDQIQPDAQDKKAARQLGKIANLSLGYRTGAKKLLSTARVGYLLPMKLKEAQHIHTTYQSTYTQVPVYWQTQITNTKQLGYVETYAGRRVQIDKLKWNKNTEWELGSTAINFKIQGTGADQKFLALKAIKPYLREIGGYFAWDLHDGLYFFIPNNAVTAAVRHIKGLLDNLPYAEEWGFTPPVQLPWDCKIGSSWGDLAEYDFGDSVKGEGEDSAKRSSPSSLSSSTHHLEEAGSNKSLGLETNTSNNVVQGVNFGSTLPKNNQEFLGAIFGEKWPDAWVTSYPPSWHGGRASRALPKMQIENSAYYAVSLMTPEASARSVKNVDAQYVIVLDDVGGKLSLDYASQHAPKPSYIIETSPNNFHWGYILSNPEKNKQKLKAFWTALSKSPWGAACDGDDAARYMRMPYGNAFKPEYKGFNTKLTHWLPETRYSLESLSALLGISIESVINAADTSVDDTASEAVTLDAVDMTRDQLKNDALFQVWDRVVGLRAEGSKDGAWQVVCPWGDLHTTGADTAKYWPSIDKFKCHHGHCSDKTTHDVAIKFGTDPRTAARYICEVFTPQPMEDRVGVAGGEGSGSGSGSKSYTFSPFSVVDPAAIPPRKWLYGAHYVRKFASASVAPGGVGKSSIVMVEVVSMCIGRGLLDKPVKKPLKVYYWNGEDPMDELHRRFAAIILHYQLSEKEQELLTENLFVDSAREDGKQIKIAFEEKFGVKIAEPLAQQITQQALANGVDVIVIDPFISCHSVPENSNTHIDAVAKRWAKIAGDADCAVELVHHVRKTNGAEVTIEDGRGGGALMDACRAARAFNRMSDDEAKQAGIPDNERWLYIREGDGKPNMAPPEFGKWRKMVSVILPNATLEDPADNVGVATTWKWEMVAGRISELDLAAILRNLDRKDYAEHFNSPDWAGHMIGEILNIDSHDKEANGGRAKIRMIITQLIQKQKVIKIVEVQKPGKSKSELRKILKSVGWTETTTS